MRAAWRAIRCWRLHRPCSASPSWHGLAFLALDAVTRTIFRLFVSRKNLLQWVTFAQSAYSRRAGWGSTLLQMAGSVTFVFVSSILIGMRDMTNLWSATPFLALWGFSPVLARWASQSPRVEPHLEMSDSDRNALRVAARRTWMFFETFVTAGDNALPPDNFQEDPAPVVAHRTSPTNIGGYLCSLLAAHDMGWIGTAETVERLEETFASLQKLERFRGHFMNWYDTSSLRSLEPRYISTVDSGNLAGNLLVVKNACHELVSPARTRDGARLGLPTGWAWCAKPCKPCLRARRAARWNKRLEPLLRTCCRGTVRFRRPGSPNCCPKPPRYCMTRPCGSHLYRCSSPFQASSIP